MYLLHYYTVGGMNGANIHMNIHSWPHAQRGNKKKCLQQLIIYKLQKAVYNTLLENINSVPFNGFLQVLSSTRQRRYLAAVVHTQ